MSQTIDQYFVSKKSCQFNDKDEFFSRKLNECEGKSECKLKETENNEIQILRSKNHVLEKNLKQAKSLLRKANDLNMQKDLEIKALKEKLNGLNEIKPNQMLFESLAHRFDSNEMKKIRSIRAGKRNDSTFILSITKALYKNEEEKLKERRVTSRKIKNQSKFEISAEKKEIMRGMLEERLVNELKDTGESDEIAKRLKRLNEHMRNALKNSVVAHKKQKTTIHANEPTSTNIDGK